MKVMEDNENFNAGLGSKLTMYGHVEMDASVMVGEDMKAGAVASVTNMSHPIVAARAVMEKTPHVLLVGPEAIEWAYRKAEIEPIDEDLLITDYARELLDEWLKEHNITESMDEEQIMERAINHEINGKWRNQKGTVGAVAIDAFGHIAAGTSTGGITGKLPGRVGDSPSVGHGVFADDQSVGVSCTGTGETFIRMGVARRISTNVENGLPPEEAILEALYAMEARVGGDGGAIAISKEGEVGIGWNSEQMAWAFGREGLLHYGVNRGEDFVEDI